jgi:RNA polymerase sigma-70 factor (ECF subfamily)
MELDTETIHRAQRGDRLAQAALLRRYAPILHAVIRRTWPGGDGEELTQILCERLLRVLDRFDTGGAASLATWVFTVAHRWLIDERRRRHLAVAPLADAVHLETSAPRPDALVEQSELRAALESAISALPEAQRRVFVLAHVHEQPLELVAEVEGVPVGTVKSRLFRARAELASSLRSHLDDLANGGPDAVGR